MKLIKKATPTTADNFKAGQEIEVTTTHFDGRGHESVAFVESVTTQYTVVKVNKVTIDITDAKGDTYRLDPTTVQHIAVVKKPRKSAKKAKSAGAYVEWAKAHEARGGFEENRYGLR
jgi:hypothetical protein